MMKPQYSARWQAIKQMLEPYRDIIVFVIVLFGANFFWKLTIDAHEDGGPVHWLGLDISLPFDWMTEHITSVVYACISLFRDTIHRVGPVSMWYESGNAITIVWGCTAIKQSFIWLCIMLFTRGSWLRKLWFIPLGWVVCYAFNIFRIFCISLVIEHHPEYFEFLHTYVFKYIFYGILFLLWVWWVEKIAPSPPKGGNDASTCGALPNAEHSTPQVSQRQADLVHLFCSFFKIGAFTLGGGYAMIPLVQREVVEKKRWIAEDEFLNMLALAQSAPGVMAANTAIFIGYKMRGWKGVVAALLGSILPSFLIILLIATVFTRFRDYPAVEAIFKGIRPAVVALIAAPLYKMARSAGMMKVERFESSKVQKFEGYRFESSKVQILCSWLLLLIPIAVALLIWLCDISPIWIILLTIVSALCIVFFKQRKEGGV